MGALLSNALDSYPLEKPVHELDSMHQKVVFNKVDETAQKITAKYGKSPEDFYNTICGQDTKDRLRSELHLNTYLFDTKKLLKIMACSTGIGAGLGFVVTGIPSLIIVISSKGEASELAIKLVAAGTLTGTAIGSLVGIPIAYKIAKAKGRIKILNSPQFKEWKKSIGKEKYDLFLNCLKNHSAFMEEPKNEKEWENYICPITHEIPAIPVISPNGHIYEKEAIEKHLDTVWARIQGYLDDGYVEADLQDKLVTVCPLRGKPFKKEDLKYASEFVKKVSKKLETAAKKLEIAPKDDDILKEGIVQLYDHYRRTEDAISIEVMSRLSEELLQLGASDEQREKVRISFTRFMRAKAIGVKVF